MEARQLPTDLIRVRQLPATATPLRQEPLVLLHGWGSDSGVFEPLVAALDGRLNLVLVDLPGFGCGSSGGLLKLDELLQALRRYLPRRCVLLGWSLGGMLATQYASRYPQQVSALVTLASNLAFVARPDWAPAMPGRVFQQFYSSFKQQPQQALRRFDSLQAQGDSNEPLLRKQLRHCRGDGSGHRHQPPPHSHWLRALGLLASIDNRRAFKALAVPGLHLLGGADSLVPAAAAPAMAGLNPAQSVQVLAGAGHALPLSQPRELARRLSAFLCRQGSHSHRLDNGQQLDKSKVAASFSRAAATYDSVAELQRRVGGQLLAHLDAMQLPAPAVAPVLDLGCGTGCFSGALARRFGDNAVLGLDIAEGMLQFARRRCRGEGRWLCADAERLPLADNSVDGIFSSLTVQWCEQLTPLFQEMARVIRPGGWLALATLGPHTLHELRSAWSRVDSYTHVNRFAPRGDLQRALARARFADISWRGETVVMQYREVRDLTRELKALGAHNVNAGKSAGLTGRRRIQQFLAAYEPFRRDGKLPATYEVYYGFARVEGEGGGWRGC